MPLVTPTQITALRNIAFRGLDTPFTVWRATQTETAYGTEPVFTQISSGLCWIRMMNKPNLHEEDMREAATSIYRLHTSPDVDIDVSDEVHIGDLKYIVQDTNFDDTIQVFRTALVRRLS